MHLRYVNKTRIKILSILKSLNSKYVKSLNMEVGHDQVPICVSCSAISIEFGGARADTLRNTVDFHPEGQVPSYFKMNLGRVWFTSNRLKRTVE